MKGNVVIVGIYAVSLDAVASMHWERDRLFVHLVGGRFLQLGGSEAHTLWDRYTAGGVVAATGEVIGA